MNLKKDYTDVLRRIIDDEAEGRCCGSECALWLYDMGLMPEDLTELGYSYLNDLVEEN